MSSIVAKSALLTVCSTLSLCFSAEANAAGKSCVRTLASAPYCMTVATALMNCQQGPQEVQGIMACFLETHAKMGNPPLTPQLRDVVYRICLIDEATDSRPGWNSTLCR